MPYPVVIAPTNEVLDASKVIELVRADYGYFALKSSDESKERFVNDNLLAYTIVTNTWLLQAHDFGGISLMNGLKEFILMVGVRTAILEAASYADNYIARLNRDGVNFRRESSSEHRFLNEVEKMEPRRALQLLRYPKRLSIVMPNNNSVLHQKSVTDFEAVNRELRGLYDHDRLGYYGPDYGFVADTVIPLARYIIGCIVGEFPGFSGLKFPRFGPGSARNASGTIYGKYEHMVQTGFYVPMHFVPLVSMHNHPDLEIKQRFTQKGKKVMGNLVRPDMGTGPIPQVARQSSVPKKVNQARGIAIEDPINMSPQLFCKEKLEERIQNFGLSTQMPIREQWRNQDAAAYAVLTNALATVDLSHASDSVAKALVQRLFPESWWNAFARCIPHGYILRELDQGPRRLNIFATMGCGCTFAVETLVFFSLTLATKVAWRNGFDYFKTRDSYKTVFQHASDVYAMGDDIICPSELVEPLERVFTQLGFRINREKTFASGYFRESCGKEYVRYDSTDPSEPNVIVKEVSTTYFPRIPIKGTWEDFCSSPYREWSSKTGEPLLTCGLARLIALQQSLYSLSPTASDYLAQLLVGYAPQLTRGCPRQGATDLYSEISDTVDAVFVGGRIPIRFRTERGLVLPDGYVACTQYTKYCDWAAILPMSDLEYFHYTRNFHTCVERAGKVEDVAYQALLTQLRYELTLQNNGGDAWSPIVVIINNGVAEETTLGRICGFRPEPISEQALLSRSGFSVGLTE